MKKMLKPLLAGAFLASVCLLSAQAQLATYTVTTSNDAHNTADPNDVAATQSLANGVTAPATDLVAGPDLGVGYAFGYTVSANQYYFPTTLAGAETAGTYLTFSIAPQTGNALHLTDINLTGVTFSSDFAGSNGQNGQPASGYIVSLTSSLDNYQTSLGDTAFNFGTTGTDIALPSSPIKAPVTFHLDFYGTEPNEAAFVYLTLSDGSVLTINGSSTIIPEPSTYALLALGGAALVVLVRRRISSVA